MKFAAIALSLWLMGCPEVGGGAAAGGDGTGGSSGGDHPVGSTPPVALAFTSPSGAPVHLKSIASGMDFYDCGIGSDDQVYCWGFNGNGGLGHSPTPGGPDAPAAVNLGTGMTVKDLAVGYQHACAILGNGSVKCWGFNRDGQLGVGDTNNRGASPAEMGDNLPALDFGPGLTAKGIAAGEYHSCAILSDDSLRCWGGASAGELGTGDFSNSPVVDARKAKPVFTGIAVTQVSCGSQHTCAVTSDGQLSCWGMSSDGELGIGDEGLVPAPRHVNVGMVSPTVAMSVRQVAANGYHTCAVLNDGSLKCWGSNFQGELGIGSDQDHFDLPQAVALPAPVKMVAVKHDQSCALLEDGQLMCWGLAKLTRFLRPVGKTSPYHVTNLNGKTPVAVATGDVEACVLTDDGTTYCLNDMQLYDFKP